MQTLALIREEEFGSGDHEELGSDVNDEDANDTAVAKRHPAELVTKLQQFVNIVLRDDKDARITEGDKEELKAISEKLKRNYEEKVSAYFEAIHDAGWTSLGFARFAPPPPLKKEHCAINNMAQSIKAAIEEAGTKRRGNMQKKVWEESVRYCSRVPPRFPERKKRHHPQQHRSHMRR